MHADSKATALRNTSIWYPIFESIRSLLELLENAGGRVTYFATLVRFTPHSPAGTAHRRYIFLEPLVV